MTADSATSAERWEQVKAILETVLDLPPTERLPHLGRACNGDEDLEREVLAYLDADEEAGDFIVQPIFSLRGDGAADPNLGRVIGAYRLVKCLARGGMGAVYLGERADQEFEQKAALKLIKRGMDTDEIVGRFRAERQILAHLVHPSIARLLDGGTTDDGLPYFVMEYVEGVPLNVYCDEERLPLRRRLEIFEEVCRAVQFAHRNLVVHRDLKPGNILVSPEGRPKLLDFGIAKLLAPHDAAGERRVGPALVEATLQGTLPLTPAYASPEQARGEPITTASDVYSLGVVLYELLTGHRPYEPQSLPPGEWPRVIAETLPARPSTVVARPEDIPGADGIVRRIEPHEVASARRAEPRQLAKTLKGDLDNIILTALAKEPGRRYGSAGELADDIHRYLEDLPVRAQRDSKAYRLRKFVQRNTAAVVAASVFVLVLMVFAGAMTYLFVEAEAARARAVTEQRRSERVLEFFVEVLEEALPDRAQGQEVTVKEAMGEVVKGLRQSGEIQSDPLLAADLMEGTGRIFWGLNESEEAADLLNESLSLRLQHMGPDNLKVGRTMNLLSLVRRNEEERDKGKESEEGREGAYDLLLRAAAVLQPLAATSPEAEKIYGGTLGNLASLKRERGELEEARQLAIEALRILRKHYGEGSGEVLTTRLTLARIDEEENYYDKAEDGYRAVYEGWREIYGDEPRSKIAFPANSLAVLLLKLGQCEEGEKFVNENLRIRRALYQGSVQPLSECGAVGSVSSDVGSGLRTRLAVALNTQGFFLESCGRPDEAIAPYAEAMEIFRAEQDYRSATQIQRNLASALGKNGDLEDCVQEASAVRAVYKEAGQDGKSPMLKTENILGGCLAGLGRYEEAEPLLQQSWAGLESTESDPRTRRDALERFVSLYEAMGNEEEAEHWRGELAAVEEEIAAARQATS